MISFKAAIATAILAAALPVSSAQVDNAVVPPHSLFNNTDPPPDVGLHQSPKALRGSNADDNKVNERV